MRKKLQWQLAQDLCTLLLTRIRNSVLGLRCDFYWNFSSLSLSLSLKLSGTLIIHKTPSKLAPYEFKLRSKPSSVLENLLFKIIFVVKILADPKLAMHVSSFHKVCWNCAGFQFIPPVLYQAHLDRRQKRKDPERYIHCVSQRNSMALG